MQLAFSNIAWNPEEQSAVLETLGRYTIGGIEVAPTKLWPDWIDASPESAAAYRRQLADQNFVIPAFQALLFGCPELQVFGTRQQQANLLSHLARVADLAAAMGAKVLVFGSPGNRNKGDLTDLQAMDQAVPVFTQIAEICCAAGLVLGIEANPDYYRCNFITHWQQAETLVRRCDHPGIGFHLDSACTLLAGDDPVEAIRHTADILVHVHISEPDLTPLDAPSSDHQAIAAGLRAADYSGWCSVEMRRTETPLESIQQAAEFTRATYG